jgi:general secretion pathway protein I
MPHPDPGPRRRGQAGFTLIEVLAALTILAVVLGVGYRILGDGLAGIRQAELRAGALAIAEAQMAALGVERVLEPGRWEGEGEGYRWTLTITPRIDPPFDAAASVGMAAFRVEVAVTDPRGAILSLATTRLAGAR